MLALGLPAALYFVVPTLRPAGDPPSVHDTASRYAPSQLSLRRDEIGGEPGYRPLITNVQIADLDGDGRQDVIACDARRQRVFWYRRGDTGWEEHALADAELPAPGHATPVDLDSDGDLDVLVAVLGDVFPRDDRIGRVGVFENLGDRRFRYRTLKDDLRRVSDVQAADLDGDGDLDLAVAEFGYDHGSVLWLENRDGAFFDHELFVGPGPVHVPIADYDGDGDPDVAAVFSQDEEQVWGFENLGGGEFRPRSLHHFLNFDVGSAGLVTTDLDRDGLPDLLLVAGDNLDLGRHYPQPAHGCYWMRNTGDWSFEMRHICTLGGAYAVDAADLDSDGDTDLVLASMFNDWWQPGAASLIWLKNDGKNVFDARQIADSPTHLATVECGDLDGDGRPDVIAGGLHLGEPFDRMGRLTAWLSSPGGGP